MKHDERTDVYRLQRVGCRFGTAVTVKGSVKCISIPKDTLGIRSWGRVDYLVKHCHYSIVPTNTISYSLPLEKSVESKSYKEIKKEKKAPKLTDKTKKVNKKK